MRRCDALGKHATAAEACSEQWLRRTGETLAFGKAHFFQRSTRRVFDESRALYRVVKIDRNIHHRDAAFRCIARHMDGPRQYNCAFA